MSFTERSAGGSMRALLWCLWAWPALAAPVIAEFQIVEGDPDGGVVFPVVTADGGARHAVRLRSTGNTTLQIDAITIIGDDANVFQVEGVIPSQLRPAEERDFAFHFRPFNKTGTFAGRVVIDWNDIFRDDHLILCGTSSDDGGMPSSCSAPPRAEKRAVPTSMPSTGCSAAAGLCLVGVLALLRRVSSSRSS
ncbi:MAG: hypothetical protein JNM17_33275 [Archangium sp.]|nr:hypothetical protein [Archangium sp.]